MNEDFLNRKLQQRKENDGFRQLRTDRAPIDFCSNDYLGMVRNNRISVSAEKAFGSTYGSTGSRLISGNYPLIEETEKKIAKFHDAPAGLIFNSGYDANLGLLGTVPQRHDTILYDQLSHASIRDGIRLSHAFSFSFDHNDVDDLEKKLQSAAGNIFVVTESVFSMDGDIAPLESIAELCKSYKALLIVDEAHATGVVGDEGQGLVQELNMQDKCFARIHTFGKAVGCHGAIVLGSELLRNYLINFSRPFIYTTGMPAGAVLAIDEAYRIFPALTNQRIQIQKLIRLFKDQAASLQLCKSVSPIQGVIIPGNSEVKKMAGILQSNGFDVRAILYPTIPKGTERLRIVLHSYNTEKEISGLVELLNNNL